MTETCDESRDSSCEQWQFTDGREPTQKKSMRDGRRRRRERRIQKIDRIEQKTSLEESKSVETAVAVTTQESLDGIREKATMTASIDELEIGSSAGRWSSPGGAANEKTKKTNELARALAVSDHESRRHYRRLWQQVKTEEGHEFEASNTRLEHENMSTSRGVQGQR